jgi:hypothetical protein
VTEPEFDQGLRNEFGFQEVSSGHELDFEAGRNFCAAQKGQDLCMERGPSSKYLAN